VSLMALRVVADAPGIDNVEQQRSGVILDGGVLGESQCRSDDRVWTSNGHIGSSIKPKCPPSSQRDRH